MTEEKIILEDARPVKTIGTLAENLVLILAEKTNA
jgi:hypothetical protein